MTDKFHKELLKPIYDSVERFAPSNRTLIDFVNEKARGEGLARSLYKVKFIDKSQRSALQLASMTLIEFGKHIKSQNLSTDDETALLQEASLILDDAKKQVEKVYSEVRRFIVTRELRNDCLNSYFKKIPTLSDEQNQIISKEIFSLALEEIQATNRSIDGIEEEFQKINHIAIALFDVAKKNPSTSKKPVEKKPSSIWDRFF